MLDSRKIFLALAILMIASVSASAQATGILTPLSCVAQAAGTPSIRAEGVAEQVGDVIIICNGGTVAALGEPLRQVNIQVFTSPSINITSRLLVGSSSGATSFSEAVLFIDEPIPSKQTICGSAGVYPYSIPPGSSQSIILGVCGNHVGTGTGIGTYDPDVPVGAVSEDGTTSRGNVYQARQGSSNSLIWQGIPFDPPGTLTSRILRLTNVRVNASQLGVPAGAQASVSLVISTSASGVSNPIALPITNPAPTVAIAQNSLTFSVVDAENCLQCENANKDFFGDNSKALGSVTTCDGITNTLRYQELFPSVFRRRNLALPSPALTGDVPPTPISQDVLGFPFETETGFYKSAANGSRWPASAQNGSVIAGISSGTLGLADHGTRLIARFNNVQNGIQIWVETSVPVISIQSGSTNLRTGTARLVTTDPNGAGPFSGSISSATPSGLGFAISLVSVVGGTGSAVYEIVNADTTAIERVNIRVVVAYLANTTNNLPSLGASTANGGLAPISTVATASSSAPLPRFVDTAVNRAFLTLNSCRTNILFPFVSNQAGFDTGLAISNTSKDPFGTSLQTGACTVNFYGVVGSSNVCLSFPSPSITGGQHFVWSLANGGAVTATAGFQGYIIAQCQFQYGHGYAFISDLGAQKLAQGYLALIMDEAIGTRTGSRSETLGH